jgi:hypothetical protein
MNNKERNETITQLEILKRLSTNIYEIKEYELKIEMIENRMDKLYQDTFYSNYINENQSQQMINSTNFFYEVVFMYEYVRAYLINNNITHNRLKNNKLIMDYDNHELDSFPATDINIFHKVNRFDCLTFKDIHFSCYQKHIDNLERYNNEGINSQNYLGYLN